MFFERLGAGYLPARESMGEADPARAPQSSKRLIYRGLLEKACEEAAFGFGHRL
jgi:hypothetical protein